MEPMIERCAGIDVHQATMVATVRSPARRGPAASMTQTFGTMTGDLLASARVAAGARGDARGHGEHRRVLAAVVLPAGRRLHAAADQHAAPEAGPGPQDGCAGQRVVGAVARMGAAARQLGAAGADSGSARADALSQAADRGPRAGSQPPASRPGRCRAEAGERDDRCDGRVGPGDARRAVAGARRIRRCWPTWRGPAAAETAGLAPRAAGPVSAAPRVLGDADSREDRFSGRDDRDADRGNRSAARALSKRTWRA